ncbi:MAG: acetyl-CoA carboxylase biotin carboxyl carrier protein [bacterium]|jgi:acetyl-CoA carboxylase biotin carboxyl carrier protein
MKISYIKKLIKIVELSEIEELEVRKWWTKVRISKRRSAGSAPGGAHVVETAAPAPPAVANEEAAALENLVEFKSPMVGTFYRAPSPGAQPYVQVGERVTPGQVVCLIEAMKLMNEIEADVAGTIEKFMVENEQPVEYGQTLFLVKPS